MSRQGEKVARALTRTGQTLKCRALAVDAALFRRTGKALAVEAAPMTREPTKLKTTAMLVDEVRAELKARGLDTLGKPQAIRARLRDARNGEAANDDDEEEAALARLASTGGATTASSSSEEDGSTKAGAPLGSSAWSQESSHVVHGANDGRTTATGSTIHTASAPQLCGFVLLFVHGGASVFRF